MQDFVKRVVNSADKVGDNKNMDKMVENVGNV
jgi:hypothetical protein